MEGSFSIFKVLKQYVVQARERVKDENLDAAIFVLDKILEEDVLLVPKKELDRMFEEIDRLGEILFGSEFVKLSSSFRSIKSNRKR